MFHQKRHINVLGYPYTEKTSDADLLEFEAGVVMSASLTTCVNYSIGIEVLLHNTQVWNSSAILSACNFSDSVCLVLMII